MLIILSISFNHLSESYFPCHLIHMTFLKAIIQMMPSTEHPQKPRVTQHSQNTYFFAEMWEAEGGYYNHFSSSHSEANTHMHNHPSEMLAWGEVL